MKTAPIVLSAAMLIGLLPTAVGAKGNEHAPGQLRKASAAAAVSVRLEDRRDDRRNDRDEDRREHKRIDWSFLKRISAKVKAKSKEKVAVCHKFSDLGAQTIYVAAPAVAAHIMHGDEGGKCAPATTPTPAPADTAAPVVSALTVTDVTHLAAKVNVTTNEKTTVKAFYSTATPVNTASAGSVSGTVTGTSHVVTLPGLHASTTYHVVVIATDEAGNKVTSGERTFTTAATPDTTAPVVTASSIDTITSVGAKAHVTASEPVKVTVYYGITSPLSILSATSTVVTSFAASQDVTLTGLVANTPYYAVIVVEDASGNKTTIAEKTFMTQVSL